MKNRNKRILLAAVLLLFALRTGYGPSENELTDINLMAVNDQEFYEYVME